MNGVKGLLSRFGSAPRELRFFVAASFVMGIGYSVVDSVFNNFLNERFALSGFERSFLEFPRELPGFLVLFVSALLWFLCSRRLGALSMLLAVVSSILIGFASPSYTVMVAWLFIYSSGTASLYSGGFVHRHGTREGRKDRTEIGAAQCGEKRIGHSRKSHGRRLFRLSRSRIPTCLCIAAVAFAIASILMFMMKPKTAQRPKMILKLRREYSLYYLLSSSTAPGNSVPYLRTMGARLHASFIGRLQILATLLMIGGVIGIGFQPFLGAAIDRLGERTVLVLEAAVLVFVCIGYGFSKDFMSVRAAFLVTCACFLVRQMLCP